jgi:organic hydroperoxide reductase OsmC/OhrA
VTEPLPHRYRVSMEAEVEGTVRLASPGLVDLESAAPAEFGGPGTHWSPETLLVIAVADCFALTFRAVARSSRYAWIRVRCQAEGVLDRVDGATRFREIHLNVELEVPEGADAAQGELLLARAERGCLVSRSLVAPVHLEAKVYIA